MVLLKWVVAGLTTLRLPAVRSLQSRSGTGPVPLPVERTAPRAATSLEPMPPLSFAGALLTGIGAILLLHGGALVFRHRELPDAGRQSTPATWEAVVRGLGGLAITAGLALAGCISRREAA